MEWVWTLLKINSHDRKSLKRYKQLCVSTFSRNRFIHENVSLLQKPDETTHTINTLGRVIVSAQHILFVEKRFIAYVSCIRRPDLITITSNSHQIFVWTCKFGEILWKSYGYIFGNETLWLFSHAIFKTSSNTVDDDDDGDGDGGIDFAKCLCRDVILSWRQSVKPCTNSIIQAVAYCCVPSKICYFLVCWAQDRTQHSCTAQHQANLN